MSKGKRDDILRIQWVQLKGQINFKTDQQPRQDYRLKWFSYAVPIELLCVAEILQNF